MIHAIRSAGTQPATRLLFAFVLLVLLAACTDTRSASTPGYEAVTASPAPAAAPAEGAAPEAAAAHVDIKLFVYRPTPLSVPVGSTVTWSNRDAIEHSVTHGTKDQPGDAFDSGLFSEGQTYTRTFDEAGAFPYFCTRHPHMQGEVQVQG